jgi:hypothetical protein
VAAFGPPLTRDVNHVAARARDVAHQVACAGRASSRARNSGHGWREDSGRGVMDYGANCFTDCGQSYCESCKAGNVVGYTTGEPAGNVARNPACNRTGSGPNHRPSCGENSPANYARDCLADEGLGDGPGNLADNPVGSPPGEGVSLTLID